MLDAVIRDLYEYNAWANSRILDTATRLTPEQLLAPGGASFDSVRDTLAHTMGAQWLYLERWHGRSPRAMPDPQECPDLAAVRACWDPIERDTQAFVAGRDDARPAQIVDYTNSAGQPWA